MTCAFYTALADLSLLFFCPAADYGFAREVHNRIKPGNGFRRQHGVWIPLNGMLSGIPAG
jgi:hypothetical protein